MKRKIFFTLFAILCLLTSIVFTACSDSDETDTSNGDTSHVHSYGEWKTVKEPTCTEAGEKEKKCSCGEKVTEPVSVLEHVFDDEDGKCTCGASDGLSYGLEYKLSSGGDYYIVTGIGTCTDKNLIIPGTYNGLPVKIIDGLMIRGVIDSIVISEGVEIVETLLDGGSECKKITLPKSLRAISANAFAYSNILEVENLSCTELSNRVEEYDGDILYEIDNIYTATQGKSCFFETDDGFVFYSNGDKNYLVGYDESKTELVLPTSCNGKSYKIYDELFARNKNLVSVTMNGDISDVGEATFRECSNLERVVLPNGITEIKYFLFNQCSSLKEIVIPEGVKSIGMACFTMCESLGRLVLPQGILEIGEYTFDGLTNLKSVTIPSSLTATEICIYNCPNLTEINNLSDAEIIRYEATEEEKEEFVFEVREGVPYLVEYNGDYENVVLPKDYNGQKYVVDATVWAKTVTLSSGILELRRDIRGDKIYVDSLETLMGIECNYSGILGGNSGFGELYVGGSLLTDLAVPKGTTKLNAYIFSGIKLSSITLPKELKSISGRFGSIGRVYIEDLSAWCDIDFEKRGSNPLCNVEKKGADLYVENEKVTHLVIPQDVREIKPYAFAGCGSILSVTFPEGLTEIGTYSFCDTPLMKVVLPSTLNIVEIRAFSDCYSIVEIYNPSSLDTAEVFKNSTVLEDANVFTTLDDKGGSIEILGDYIFYTYEGKSYLVRYTGNETDVVLPENYKGGGYAIYNYAFAQNDSFYTVKIPEGVTEVGIFAFEKCYRLAEIYIPKTVKTLKGFAFSECINLCIVELADGVEEIGEDAFGGCRSLLKVSLPRSLKDLGSSAFFCCHSLPKIEIPAGIEGIGASAFYECRNLTIYCEAQSQPNGWNSNWNSTNCPVVWGYEQGE